MFPVLSNRLICYFKIMALGQLLVLNFFGQVDNHFPADQLLQFAQGHSFIFPKIVMKARLKDAMLIFADYSNVIAVYAVDGKGYVVLTDPTSD